VQARKGNFGVKPGLDMRAFHKSLTLETDLWMRRWRWFFLATAGLFGYADGSEWGVCCCHARESGHPVIRDVGIEH
jgi:hypothetical protein